MWGGLITRPTARRSFLSAARQSGSFERFFVLLGALTGQSLAPVFAFAGARGRGLQGVLPPPAFGRLRPRFAVPAPREEERPRRAIPEAFSAGRWNATTSSLPR
jgi:hypothetical protein